jgi:hypothetical protein
MAKKPKKHPVRQPPSLQKLATQARHAADVARKKWDKAVAKASEAADALAEAEAAAVAAETAAGELVAAIATVEPTA